MKISIEILESKFKYSYEVGSNKANGDRPLNADSLCLFTEVLQACNKSHMNRTIEEINDIRCMAYIEKHPEMIKKYKEMKLR